MTAWMGKILELGVHQGWAAYGPTMIRKMVDEIQNGTSVNYTLHLLPTCFLEGVLRLLFVLLLLASSRWQWALPDFICQPQSSASSRSQWALPDFSPEHQIAVGTAGLQLRAPDRNGHCRTSAATARSQWALPDFSRDCQIAVGTAGRQPRPPDRTGHCRTSAATARSHWAGI
eukprot:s444_g57.t1